MEENLPPPKGGDPWWQYVLWAAIGGLGLGPVLRDHIKAVLRRREKRISVADELMQSLRQRIDHLEAEVKELRARLSECEKKHAAAEAKLEGLAELKAEVKDLRAHSH